MQLRELVVFCICAVPILVISEGCPSGDHKHFEYQLVHSSDQDNKMKEKLKIILFQLFHVHVLFSPCTS